MVDIHDLTDKVALLVEDEKLTRRIIGRCLKNMGLCVLVAGDGQEALEVLARNPVDVILSDVNMPNMSGLEMMAALPESDRQKVILCSGTPQDPGPCSTLQIYQKPIEKKKLRELILGVLAH